MKYYLPRLTRLALLIGLLSPALHASYDFTGAATDRITLGTGAVPTAAGTILASYKTDATFTSAGADFIFEAQLDGNNIFALRVNAGNWECIWYTAAVEHVVRTATSVPGASSAWTEVGCTWDDTANEVKLYHEGVQIGTTATTLVTFTSTLAKQIGNDTAIANNWVGRLAKVALYNAVVSAANLTAHGNNSTCASAIPNITAHWDLGTNANDSVGTDHGTVTGATLQGDHPTCGTAPVTPRLLLGVF